MSATREWAYGDRVMHAKRPEWGAGVVTAAQKVIHEGRPCQRLTIRFDRAGIKTLSTAMAELQPATELPPAVNGGNGASQASAEDAEWMARLSGASSVPDQMLRIPEACSDPFSPLTARLKATLNLYRFTDTGASLLDWAAAQSGLKDPMTRFNRHELEVLFQKFGYARDEHLKRLVLEMKKKDPAELSAMVRSAPPAAQQALRRLDVGR